MKVDDVDVPEAGPFGMNGTLFLSNWVLCNRHTAIGFLLHLFLRKEARYCSLRSSGEKFGFLHCHTITPNNGVTPSTRRMQSQAFKKQSLAALKLEHS